MMGKVKEFPKIGDKAPDGWKDFPREEDFEG